MMVPQGVKISALDRARGLGVLRELVADWGFRFGGLRKLLRKELEVLGLKPI